MITIIIIIMIVTIIMICNGKCVSGKSALQVSKKFNIPSRTLYDKVALIIIILRMTISNENDDNGVADDGDDDDDDDDHDVFCPGEENGDKHWETTAAEKHEQQLRKRLWSILRFVIITINIIINIIIIIMTNIIINISVMINIIFVITLSTMNFRSVPP